MYRLFCLLLIITFTAFPIYVTAQEYENKSLIDQNSPVNLEANQMSYDEQNEIVHAFGNVVLTQNNRTLKTDKITYMVLQDKVVATGNVELIETTGEIYKAEEFELTNQMKDGFVRGLYGSLADGGYFTAEEGQKIQDREIIMKKASYTACEACKTDPSKSPAWQLRARDIKHDKEAKQISYKDATLEIKGIPIAYIPHFSHPDGSVKRKSGFLTPSIGFDSELGANYQQEYYWNIAPDKDATVGAALFTDVSPLVTGEYRQRFKKAKMQINAGTTYSERTDRDGQGEFLEDHESRGYINAKAVWNLNEKWRAGTTVNAVSDKQFLRQYNISNEDVLENRLYAERFDKRDYTLIQAKKFKDVRVSSAADDQPDILPEIYTKFMGDPNKILGGTWHLEATALGLQREGNDPDTMRVTAGAGWSKSLTSHQGIVTTVDISARGDAYKTDDIMPTNDGGATDDSILRGYASTHIQTSYPVAKPLKSGYIVVEPKAALTAVTDVKDNGNGVIPNEDSQDVFLDATNIFNANRFPGYDKIEDRIHATYGTRMGYHGDDGKKAEMFIGQSYRFNDDGTDAHNDNPFTNGSGLDEKQSDIVGSLSVDLSEQLSLNYGLQLKNDTLASQRHEADIMATIGKLDLNARYFYADALDGTNLDTRREQIRTSGKYHLNDEWALYGGIQYDLARETEGLRQTLYGVDYNGQCVTFNVNAKRNLTSDSSGDSGTQIMMRVGLKTLGEFETSAFTIGGSDLNSTNNEEDNEDSGLDSDVTN